MIVLVVIVVDCFCSIFLLLLRFNEVDLSDAWKRVFSAARINDATTPCTDLPLPSLVPSNEAKVVALSIDWTVVANVEFTMLNSFFPPSSPPLPAVSVRYLA